MLFYFLGGNMLIEKFKIVKLFNYTDFEYNFKNKDTIFIGENGTGKTTILSIFYHVLSMNIKELLKYEFRKIIIKYKGKKDITIAYDELEKYYENYNNFFDKSYLNSHIGKKIIEIISKNSEKFKFDDSNQDLDFNLNLAIKLIKNEKIKVPVGFIREILRYFEYQKKFKNVDDYINITSIILEGYRILYFPTYRRIEEDLEDINIYDIDDDESHSTSIFKKRISRSQNNHIGELIQFGMKDVQITIDNLLDTIKKQSIDSFNKMTGELLSQYVRDDLEHHQDIETLTDNEIRIALSRAGINDDLKNNILNKFSKNKFKDNNYLSNFILNLVEKNKILEPIDKKIKDFEENCNKYLYNKKFIYDPSAVTLEILNPEQNRKIEISHLSSGEKQIISTFSKIYLEENKNLIVLFDEPELSLSIEWQKDFIYDIARSDNCKFSISVTHSPFIFEKLLKNTTSLNKYLSKKG